ncbi:6-carboxytetrahydropterin synthase, partial [Nannocystis sp.]|uniref:6-pyruvoyl trahydropterin synthase family protein n=1 Tax=Nannocystis sp. TaxID=1962667 RepID=UPI00344FB6AC|nr:6-carboxytetrahydropterin synthase [Nannocystis sp.]
MARRRSPRHKCARPHGHSYTIEVRIRGEVGEDSGWILDLGDPEPRLGSRFIASSTTTIS